MTTASNITFDALYHCRPSAAFCSVDELVPCLHDWWLLLLEGTTKTMLSSALQSPPILLVNLKKANASFQLVKNKTSS